MTGYMIEKKDGPKGKWFKVNLSKVSDTKFTVSGLIQDESYEFRVLAKNAVGSVSNPSDTVGPVTCVDTFGAPEIELPQEYLDVLKYKAGETVQLRTGIIAKPQPTIEWYKDGKELESGAQYIISNTTDSACISIKDATRINTGTYELKIKNSLGSAYAAIRVLIQGMLPIIVSWLSVKKKKLHIYLCLIYCNNDLLISVRQTWAPFGRDSVQEDHSR